MKTKLSLFVVSVVSSLFIACGEKEQEITVQSIAISQPSAELVIGETLNLKATVSPSNASYDGITWTSTKTSVATVSGSGLVSALAEGNTTITAMAGGKTASCSITVVKRYVAVSSISLNKESLELIEGDSETLTATVSPNDATDKTVSWSSSNTGVATVKDGTITAVKEGETTITAKAGEKTVSCRVIVAKKIIPVESIELNKTELDLVEGETETLMATVLPKDATDKTITWTSSKEGAATVKDGTITAVKEGEATIIAKAGEKAASCKVVVSKRVIPVESIELNKTELELIEGNSETLTATISPDDATDKAIAWISSNESVATVKDGVVSAISEGEATITAKAGEKTASCKVVVAKKVIPVEMVSLDKESLEIKIGESATLIATVKPDDATENSVSWYSSDEAVVSVDNTGVVVGISEGNAMITAKAGDKSGSCSVYVSKDPKDEAIIFADKKLEAVLVTSFDTNGDGLLSFREATYVTSKQLYNAFSAFVGANTVSSFDEFQYFTGVTSLQPGMFEDWGQMTSIVLPRSLTKIEASAFLYCVKLVNIVIPETITIIGPGAFVSCRSLSTITLPENLIQIQEGAFNSCSSLITISIPESVTMIGKGAFTNCSALTSLTVPKGITEIDDRVFWDCNNLKSIVFNGNITSIGSYAFRGCSNLSSISIPDSVTKIGGCAFQGCTNLLSIALPKSLMSIGSYAFDSVGIAEVRIPQSVILMGKTPFIHCRNITSITVEQGNTIYDSRNNCNAIIETQSNKLLQGCPSTIIPNSIEQIGPDAFNGCSGLTSVNIPAGVNAIMDNAFHGCSSLRSITIPRSVKSIELQVFYGCSGLSSITILAETPPIGGPNIFYDTNNAPIYVPSESVDAYKAAQYWSDYASRIQSLQE